MTPFDPKCHELATHILGAGASDERKNSLANEIQCAVEDWLEEEAEEAAQERADNGQFGVGT